MIQILRLPAVKARTGLGRSSIYLRVADGEFPKPVSLGPRCIGWIASEVESWIASKVRERDGDSQENTKAEAQRSHAELPAGSAVVGQTPAAPTAPNRSSMNKEVSFRKATKIRDQIVRQREAKGVFVSSIPQFKRLIDDLRARITSGALFLEEQHATKNVLSEIEAAAESFASLDSVRRKVGNVFRGVSVEGYDAIGKWSAKFIYTKISEIQILYAGKAQERLLDEYAKGIQGMSIFSSKKAKKAAA